jgi:hypothetical protein
MPRFVALWRFVQPFSYRALLAGCSQLHSASACQITMRSWRHRLASRLHRSSSMQVARRVERSCGFLSCSCSSSPAALPCWRMHEWLGRSPAMPRFPFQGMLSFTTAIYSETNHMQVLEQGQPLHAYACQCSMAGRSLLHMPRPDRYRQHANHHRHLQHHRASLGYQLHRSHHRTPLVRRKGAIPPWTLHNGQMEQTGQRHCGDMGHLH